MPQTPHIEKHFTTSETVRDIVIGMSDGLTVPFALAAGLSGAVESTSLIITAGLAELAAGAIAMGLPFSPLGPAFGFTPLPLLYWPLLVVTLLGYRFNHVGCRVVFCLD